MNLAVILLLSIMQPEISSSIGDEINPKLDEAGRFWRELRCLFCRHWFGDEYIIAGRIRLRCPKCDKITVMEFRMRKRKRKGRIHENKQLKEGP